VTAPLVVAVSGFSGSGKTRLLARLIPALARRGVTTAVVKHTRHPHAFDRPGKDTDVLRRAGAAAAAIDGPDGMAFFGPPAGGLRALVSFLPPVDLVLAEGWKDARVPRIEVHRRRIARAFLCSRDPHVFAVVTDEPPPRRVPAFSSAAVAELAELVCSRFGLGRPSRKRARLRVRPGVSSLRAEGSGRTVAPGRRKRMAKTTSGSRRGAGRSRGSRQGAGRKGGRATLRARGPEFFSEIGRKGGKKSGARRRASARGSSRTMGGSRGTMRSRGGARSRRGGRSSSR
jgi:molybdopterin-guanine dinucleotide biosynthesis protein B